jgi:hypothetical protein
MSWVILLDIQDRDIEYGLGCVRYGGQQGGTAE